MSVSVILSDFLNDYYHTTESEYITVLITYL